MSWQVIFVPAGAPAPFIARLHEDLRKILAQREMQSRPKSFGWSR